MPDETADSTASLDETANSSVAVIDLEDDDSEPEILLDQSVSGFTSGRSLRSGTGGRDRWVLALQSFLLSPCRPAHAAATPALPPGSQVHGELLHLPPAPGGGAPLQPREGCRAEQVIAHPAVNICMDTEDDQALQYKLTDFAVYDKVSDTEQHLVPIFAESLLSHYKKLYLAGKVLRLDSEEGEEGLKVGTVSPCTES